MASARHGATRTAHRCRNRGDRCAMACPGLVADRVVTDARQQFEEDLTVEPVARTLAEIATVRTDEHLQVAQALAAERQHLRDEPILLSARKWGEPSEVCLNSQTLPETLPSPRNLKYLGAS